MGTLQLKLMMKVCVYVCVPAPISSCHLNAPLASWLAPRGPSSSARSLAPGAERQRGGAGTDEEFIVRNV